MSSCDYFGNTEYSFTTECFTEEEDINIVGNYPSNKMSTVLTSPVNSYTWTEFFSTQIVDLPEWRPHMDSILEVRSCIDIIYYKIVETPLVNGYRLPNGNSVSGDTIGNNECTNLTGKKLIIEGMLTEKITYTGQDTSTVHTVNYCTPFSTFIIVSPDTSLSQEFLITPYIEDIFVSKLSANSIFKNTTIFIRALKAC